MPKETKTPMSIKTKTYGHPFKMRLAGGGGFYVMKEKGAHTHGKPMYMLGYERHIHGDVPQKLGFQKHESRTDKKTYNAFIGSAKKNWKEMKEVVEKNEKVNETSNY